MKKNLELNPLSIKSEQGNQNLATKSVKRKHREIDEPGTPRSIDEFCVLEAPKIEREENVRKDREKVGEKTEKPTAEIKTVDESDGLNDGCNLYLESTK